MSRFAEVKVAIAAMDAAAKGGTAVPGGVWADPTEAEIAAYMLAQRTKVAAEKAALAYCREQQGEPVAWRVQTPYGVGYIFADDVIGFMDGQSSPSAPERA